MFKLVNVIAVLSFCTVINAISVDQLLRLTEGNANLNDLSELTGILQQNRGDIEVRQAPAATPAATTPAASTPAAATPAATTPTTTPAATTPSSNLSPLISGVLSAVGSVVSSNLGPLKPIADAVGPLLNSAFTGIISNVLGGLGSVLKSNDLPNSGYDTYMVNIPNQGSYIILAKSQDKEKEAVPVPVPAPVPVGNTQIKLSELLTNAIQQSQISQVGTKTPLTAAAIGATSLIKKKPLLIPLSILTALAGLAKNQKAYNDYEIILDEN